MAEIPFIGEICALASALVWALAVILFRRSGESIGPVALTIFKSLVALILFAGTLLVLGIEPMPAGRTWREVAILMVSGMLGSALGDAVFFASLNRLGAGRQAIVTCCYCPLVIVGAFLVLDEPIGWALVVATVLIGLAIVVGTFEPSTRPQDPPVHLASGVALGILAMAAMAAGVVLAKPVLDVADPVWSTSVRLVGAMIPLTLVGLFSARHRKELARCLRPGPVWRVALPAAFFGSYVAMFLWISGMTYTWASVASVLNQTSTVFTLILAALILEEALTLRKVMAIALGFAGAVIAVV